VLDGTSAGAAERPGFQVAGVVLVAAALLLYVPSRALGKYHNFRGMRADVRTLARSSGFGRSLVLVRGPRTPDYASAAVYNPVDLRADVPVYAWDRSPDVRARLLDAYPDRTVWILDGPTLTGGAYRIAAGPLTPAEARVTPLMPGDGGYAPDDDPVGPAPRDRSGRGPPSPATRDSSGGSP